MLTSIFAEKLRQVSQSLVVDFAGTNHNVNQEQGTCGVYELGKWIEIEEKDLQHLGGREQKLAKREKLYLCYVPAINVPDYTQYNAQLVAIAPGVRDTLDKIIKLRPHLKNRIEKVFGITTFNFYDWDRQSPHLRAIRQGVKPQGNKSLEQHQNTGYVLDGDECKEVSLAV